MKFFESMTKKEAKIFYEKIKNEPIEPNFKKIVLNNILYFTNNFKKDY